MNLCDCPWKSRNGEIKSSALQRNRDTETSVISRNSKVQGVAGGRGTGEKKRSQREESTELKNSRWAGRAKEGGVRTEW